MNTFHLVMKVPKLFSETLEAQNISHLIGQIEYLPFAKNEVIYYKGRTPRGIYFIEKGSVKIYDISPSNKKTLIRKYESGEVFGYHEVIENVQYVYIAIAEEEMVLGFLNSNVFKKLLEKSTELSRGFLIKMLDDLKYMAQLYIKMIIFSIQGRNEV